MRLIVGCWAMVGCWVILLSIAFFWVPSTAKGADSEGTDLRESLVVGGPITSAVPLMAARSPIEPEVGRIPQVGFANGSTGSSIVPIAKEIVPTPRPNRLLLMMGALFAVLGGRRLFKG